MGWGSGAEIGSKARSPAEEGMLVRHFQEASCSALVRGHQQSRTSVHPARLLWVGLVPNPRPPAMSLGVSGAPVGADRHPKCNSRERIVVSPLTQGEKRLCCICLAWALGNIV